MRTSRFGHHSDAQDFRTTYKYVLQNFVCRLLTFLGMLRGPTCYRDTVTALGWDDVGLGQK